MWWLRILFLLDSTVFELNTIFSFGRFILFINGIRLLFDVNNHILFWFQNICTIIASLLANLIARPDQFNFMPWLLFYLVGWHHIHYFHIIQNVMLSLETLLFFLYMVFVKWTFFGSLFFVWRLLMRFEIVTYILLLTFFLLKNNFRICIALLHQGLVITLSLAQRIIQLIVFSCYMFFIEVGRIFQSSIILCVLVFIILKIIFEIIPFAFILVLNWNLIPLVLHV